MIIDVEDVMRTHVLWDEAKPPLYTQKETALSEDVVNHPKHYNQYTGFEVIDVAEQLRAPDGTGNYNRGNAFKYLSRAGWKNPDKHVEDLEKAKFYIQREIDRLRPDVVKTTRVGPGVFTTEHPIKLDVGERLDGVTVPHKQHYDCPECGAPLLENDSPFRPAHRFYCSNCRTMRTPSALLGMDLGEGPKGGCYSCGGPMTYRLTSDGEDLYCKVCSGVAINGDVICTHCGYEMKKIATAKGDGTYQCVDRCNRKVVIPESLVGEVKPTTCGVPDCIDHRVVSPEIEKIDVAY